MTENYDLKIAAPTKVKAPKLAYQPPKPRRYRPRIGLIGCGGIVDNHLKAAQALGVEVVAFCDPNPEAATRRRDAYFPNADVYADHRLLLARDDIEVVDIATHPSVRVALVEDALNAGKHVLSQKPFVEDLETGRRLVALADARGRKLAVNQNARWAPYFSYLLQAVRGGHLGEMQTLDLAMEWDHTWIRGTAFEKLHHVILADFAIHWFDIAANVFAGRAVRRLFASAVRLPDQEIAPPMAASAVVEFDGGLATLAFNAHAKAGAQERVIAVGTGGLLRGSGPPCALKRLELVTAAGTSGVALRGTWFPDGFRGTLGELLCAIEQDREPSHSARGNLRSLEICFAAIRSADTGQAQALS
jgi:predicted dehydrogenase